MPLGDKTNIAASQMESQELFLHFKGVLTCTTGMSNKNLYLHEITCEVYWGTVVTWSEPLMQTQALQCLRGTVYSTGCCLGQCSNSGSSADSASASDLSATLFCQRVQLTLWIILRLDVLGMSTAQATTFGHLCQYSSPGALLQGAHPQVYKACCSWQTHHMYEQALQGKIMFIVYCLLQMFIVYCLLQMFVVYCLLQMFVVYCYAIKTSHKECTKSARSAWNAATGDMPVALMHDGPSLGGFVCPATITSSALWKMGQCRAGDGIVFKPTTLSKPFACCYHCP